MPKAPIDSGNPYANFIIKREQRLSDWDSNFNDPHYNKVKDLDLSEHWEQFNPWTDIGFYPYPVLPPDVELPRVVQAVFEKFGIPYDMATMEDCLPYPLGVLPGCDIRNQQASSVVNMSCAEALKISKFVEVYMDGDGVARLRKIGETSPGKLDIRYSVPTGVFRYPIDVITVTGWDPPSYRWVGDKWKDYLVNRHLIEFPFIDDIHCKSFEMKKVAFIEYDKPLIVSNWNDIIKSEYELNSWDRFIGCIYLIDWEGGAPYSFLTFSEQTRLWVDITPYGLDVHRYYPDFSSANPIPGSLDKCWLDQSSVVIQGSGVIIGPFHHFEAQWDREVSDLDSITRVMMVGNRVKTYIYSPGIFPYRDEQLTCWVFAANEIVDISPEYYALKDFFDENGFLYYKLFFKQFYENEYAASWAGHIQDVPSKKFIYLDPNSRVIWSGSWYGAVVDTYSGAGTGGLYVADFAGSIAGWVVNGVWVEVLRRKPSIVIDSTKADAKNLAESLVIKYLPIIVSDLPPPKAVVTSTSVPYPMNKIIDQERCSPDMDPRTVQDYTDSDCYRLEEDMMGNVMEFHFPFLNAEECLEVANTLFDILECEEELDQITYVCGPDSEPILGGSYPEGSRNIINSIEFSYQDSSAYHITITTGPSNFRSSFSTSLFQLQTDDYTAPALIQKSAGNGWLYLVDVYGFGLIPAVNMTTQSLDVGDQVSVTIHNNPVFSWGGRY